MEKQLKVIELFIDENSFDTLSLISLVSEPAIEENFQIFSKGNKNNYTFAKGDVLRKEITGPALIPNKQIYRINYFTGEEYMVFFSEDTIRKCAQMFMQQDKNTQTSVDHEIPVQDCFLFESWIVTGEKDKAYELGFDVPIGTWMVTYKINNKAVFDAIAEKAINGFSVEGFFSQKFGSAIAPESKSPIVPTESFLEPGAGDTEEEYIPKCIAYVLDNGEAQDESQAYAICKSKWDNHSADQKLAKIRELIKDLDINSLQ